MTQKCKEINVIHQGNSMGEKKSFQQIMLNQLGIYTEKKKTTNNPKQTNTHTQKSLDSEPHITLKN